MIALLAFLALQGVETFEVAPEEFRRKVEFRHFCVTDQVTQSGYKEVGMLEIERGENLPNFALTKSADRPPMFEKGIVAAVRGEKTHDETRLIASLNGERGGSAAVLVLTVAIHKRGYTNVSLQLTGGGERLTLFCVPTAPVPAK